MLDQEGFQDLRPLKAFTEVELLWSSAKKSPEGLEADTCDGPAQLVTVSIRERKLDCLKSKCCYRKCLFSDISWSRPGSRGSRHHQHLPRARLVEIMRAWMNWSSWWTLPDTHKVLGKPELAGTKGCFRQEHISMDISSLGLGVLPSRDSVVALLRDDGAL